MRQAEIYLGGDDIDASASELICRDLGPEYQQGGPEDIQNVLAINEALDIAQPGDTVLVPEFKIFNVLGGIQAIQKTNITIDIAGSLNYRYNLTAWPRN